MTCGILVPLLGIEPRPWTVRVQSPNHCAARQFPGLVFLFCPCCIFPIDLDCFQFLHVQETVRCFESWQGFDCSRPLLETLLRPFACWECNCCAERCSWLSGTTLLHVVPLSSCADVEYHAGLIVIRVVFLCLPSFEVDILSLALFFFSFLGLFLLSWYLCFYGNIWRDSKIMQLLPWPSQNVLGFLTKLNLFSLKVCLFWRYIPLRCSLFYKIHV